MTERLKRSEVPVEQTWDLSDLFTSHNEWENELQSIQNDVQEVTKYKGKLGEDAETLLKCLTTLADFQKRVIRVATYASLRSNADGSDPENQRDSAKVASALASIGAKLSFIESELLTISSDTLKQFVSENAKLRTYEKMLDDILEKKPYTLSPEIEETLAALGEVHDAPMMIYERSKSADMEFNPIQDDDGQKHPMSFALYEDRYELSPNTPLRRKAFDSFVHTLNQYKNTYAATYATEVTKQVTMARLRNYDSVIDMLLHPQQVTKTMYENQLNIIQEKLAPHMRKYAKLLKEQLGVDELKFCDLQAPLDPEFNPETTFEEAKSTILDALKVMGPEYSEIMKKGLNERWVDYSDNIGKSTGAFCSSPYGVHPYILITWTDTMRGAFVLAHELGHAGHFY
ncbi:MAG TPA: M3 family metallopeptidase, partial [Candidatus Dormibacteraeota bacterium]|nr:M3 family metallopeptidase [Candidatus Dormibacteraeota bacterium]